QKDDEKAEEAYAAGYGLAELILAAAQNFLKVGRLAASYRTLTPRPSCSAFPATAILTPGHIDCSFTTGAPCALEYNPGNSSTLYQDVNEARILREIH